MFLNLGKLMKWILIWDTMTEYLFDILVWYAGVGSPELLPTPPRIHFSLQAKLKMTLVRREIEWNNML
jgi:hypothetical protein